MPDPFSTLPLPLPFFILAYLEDLSTLHWLLTASRSASVLFAQRYCELIEPLISDFVPEVQQLLRLVISLRSQPLPIRDQCHSVEAFYGFCEKHILESNGGEKPLPRPTTSLSAVRSLVKTPSQIENLSAAFFATHLERLNSTKPYGSLGGNACATDWRITVPDPRLGQYETLPCEKPSWIEEQRVLRAMWWVAIWLDLKEIMRPTEGCQNEVLDLLVRRGPQSILSRTSWEQIRLHGKRFAWRLQELDCILTFLHEISTGSPNSAKQPLDLRSLPILNPIRPRTPTPTRHKDAATLFQDADANRWWQSPQYLNRPSPGFHFFHSPMCLDSPLPFRGNDFSSFRSLGLGIWDLEKLARLGLAWFGRRWEMRDWPMVPATIPEIYSLGPHKERPSRAELVIRWKNIALL